MIVKTFLFLLFAGLLFAQTTPYFPLEEGDNWLYSEFGYFTDHRATVLGDTIMPNDKTYSEVWSQFGPTEYVRQSNDSVFVYDRWLGYEYLQYYFGADSGDVITTLPLEFGDTLKITFWGTWIGPRLGRQLRSWSFGFDNVGLIDDENNRIITDSLGLITFESPHWGGYSIQGAEISGLQYGRLTSVEPNQPQLNNFSLAQNYPNPFNPTTIIQYSLPEAADVTLTIYDMAGRKVTKLVSERQTAGVYEQQFDAAQLASGVYVYRLRAGDFVQARKMLLVR